MKVDVFITQRKRDASGANFSLVSKLIVSFADET